MSVFQPHRLRPIKPPMPTFRETKWATANYTRGRLIRPIGVVFHHSCGTWEGDTAWIASPKSQVSYHCLIRETGERRVFVADEGRAWHAGKSAWRGREDCNSFLLGCAFSGDTYPDRKHGRSLTEAEIASALEWLAPRWERWGFGLDWIVDHRQVSPGRKDDLNPTEWARLLAAIKGRFA